MTPKATGKSLPPFFSSPGPLCDLIHPYAEVLLLHFSLSGVAWVRVGGTPLVRLRRLPGQGTVPDPCNFFLHFHEILLKFHKT